MTYTSRTDALEFECPNCKAAIGGKCVGARGKKRESVHRERMAAAACQLGHAPMQMMRIEGERLLDGDGNMLGRVTGVEFNLQSEEWGNLRRGEEEVVDVFPESEANQSQEGGVGEATQTEMLPDPVDETWALYVELLDRPRAKLDRKQRRWIADAHQAVGVERTRQAIYGLAGSEYHRQNGYVGIEYALKPKQGQTIESRIAMMESKAPLTGANGGTTVQTLLSRLPSEAHGMVRGWIADVEAMLRNPDHVGLSATGEARLADLRSKAHMEPVVEGQRIVGWKDLKR